MNTSQPPATLEQLQALTVDIAKKQAHITLGRKSYKVLAKLTEHPEYVATQSIVALAQWAQTSSATLSRLATKLGYDGFNDFQRVFNQSIIGERKLFYTEKANKLLQTPTLSTQAPNSALVTQLSLETAQNMNELLAGLDEAQLTRVVEMLTTSPSIRLYGLRQMHSISSFFTYGLSMVRSNVAMLAGAGSDIAESLSQLKKEDVLIVISVRPYTKMTVDVAEVAAEMDIHILALTDSLSSPLINFSKEAFLIPHKSSFISNSIGTYIMFCESLVNLVAKKMGDKAINTLKKREKFIHKLTIETD